MPNSIQNSPARLTEGQKAGQPLSGQQAQRGASANAPRKAGRPPGSKNKPKGLLPKDLASEILLQMKAVLPEDQYEYMKGVIREGKAISTKQELDTLIIILNRNLIPAIVAESMMPDEPAEEDDPDEFFKDGDNQDTAIDKATKKSKIRMPVFRKDITERLKVMQGLLTLRNQVEKRDSDSTDDEKPILRIVGGRGLDASRVRVLIGVESSPLVGDDDGTGQSSDSPRTVSDQIPERSVVLPVGEQG